MVFLLVTDQFPTLLRPSECQGASAPIRTADRMGHAHCGMKSELKLRECDLRPLDDSSGIDIDSAMARVGGDQELLQEVAQLFLDECPNMMDSIHQALAAGDSRALEFAAHTLKGAVGNFGAVSVVEAAVGIEIMARQGRLAEAGPLLAVLEKALERVNSDLTEIVSGR